LLEYVLVFLTILVVTFIYGFMNVDMLTTNISFKRYFALSKESFSIEDSKEVFLRLLLAAINIFMALYSLSICLFSENSSLNFNAGFLGTYIVADLALFYILHLKQIKQRHDILVFLRIGLLDMLISLMVIACIAVNVQGVYVLDIVLFQGELSFGLPKWNIVILLPLYYIWNACKIDVVRSLPRSNSISEIDNFQMRILYCIRNIAWISLSVVLFMGGATIFEALDSFNLSYATLEIVKVVLVILKFMFLLTLIKVYRRFVGPKKLVELENLYRRRTLLTIIMFLVICAYKVVLL